MSGLRARQWNIYGAAPSSSSSSSSSSSLPSQSVNLSKEGQWKSVGSSSMNAISFGFVATAILISMFLIMAIFEHLFRPNSRHDESSNGIGSTQLRKLGAPEIVERCSESHVSVVMVPGEQYPTYIAQPAPLPLPCQREGVYNWPSHQQHTIILHSH